MDELKHHAVAARPNIYRSPDASSVNVAEIKRTLSFGERLMGGAVFRRCCILVVLAATWQLYGSFLNNDLLLPTFVDTIKAFYNAIVHGPLLMRTMFSLKVLLIG
ncbi:MAG TPA: ABC transporter permease, partial [Afipia sp.]